MYEDRRVLFIGGCCVTRLVTMGALHIRRLGISSYLEEGGLIISCLRRKQINYESFFMEYG